MPIPAKGGRDEQGTGGVVGRLLWRETRPLTREEGGESMVVVKWPSWATLEGEMDGETTGLGCTGGLA